jgi:prophage regulatory protein
MSTEVPEAGFIRLAQIVGPKGIYPVSKSTWWAGVASGVYPKPYRLSARVTAWKAEDIRALIEQVTSNEVRSA